MNSSGKVSSQRYVSVGAVGVAGSGPFLEAIPNRVGIIISAPTVDILVLSLNKVASATSGGIALHPGADPLILTAEEHGDLPTRAWSAVMLGGSGEERAWSAVMLGGSGEDINVVETFFKG